jgi:acetate kinase
MNILVLNSGSSSQKMCLYEIGDTLPEDAPAPLWKGEVELDAASSHEHAVENLLTTVQKLGKPGIDMAGHRVVHGGLHFEEPIRISPEVKSAIAGASVFAPLHNKAELKGIELVERVLGPIPQAAVFDTGYHRKMPAAAAIYPGPFEWFDSGIRRYGFHGINHQFCVARAARLMRRDLNSLRIVTCHLGNGCSLAASFEGRSVDTTMGFTPLEGLMMGTRSGSVDPGILTYLMRQGQLQSPDDIDAVLNHKSGLLGISGLSSDMREILAAMNKNHPRARLAFDIYVHRLRTGIGAMVAALGGLDALVFTAGVGENSTEVRAAVCSRFDFLGLELDLNANAVNSPDTDVATKESHVRIFVIRAQENWAIAKECWKLSHA